MKKLLTVATLAVYLLALLPVATSTAQTVGGSCTGTPGTMSFLPASGDVFLNSSGNITVDVIVNPAGCEAGAADVTVLYDTTKLQFLPSDPNTKYINQGEEGNPANYFKNNISINPIAPGQIRMARYIDPGSTTYTTQSGKFARLAFKPLVAVGQTVTLNSSFQAGNTADFTSIAGKAQGSDILGSFAPATLTIAQGVPPSTIPTITSVTPNSGDKNLAQSVTISGTNFGATAGTVEINAGFPATVTSWSATSIVATVPTWPSLTANRAANVIVRTSTNQTATLPNGYTYTVSGQPPINPPINPPYIPGQNTGGTQIYQIRPASGNKNLPTEVEIIGTGFGTYNPETCAVSVGIERATVLDWSNNRIVAQVPPQPGILGNSTRSVNVACEDGRYASFLGFTYGSGNLPSSGSETWVWAGLVMASLGLAAFTYRKLAVKVGSI